MSLKRAIYLARQNPIIGVTRMAAVITDGKREVSWGWNSRKTHPLILKFGNKKPHYAEKSFCVHAELAAIIAARCDLSGMTMHVARVLRDDQIGLAKPCKGCQSAILAFNIKHVHWTQPS